MKDQPGPREKVLHIRVSDAVYDGVVGLADQEKRRISPMGAILLDEALLTRSKKRGAR